MNRKKIVNHKNRNRRSIIFYSALEPKNWDNGVKSGADMFCLDMEDSTSADRKDEARKVCLPLFERNVDRPVVRLVRINLPRSDEGIRDILCLLYTSPSPRD